MKPLIKSNKSNVFLLPNESAKAFETFKSELASACLTCVNKRLPFTVERDASNYTLAVSLNQGCRPIAFHSRTFSPGER